MNDEILRTYIFQIKTFLFGFQIHEMKLKITSNTLQTSFYNLQIVIMATNEMNCKLYVALFFMDWIYVRIFQKFKCNFFGHENFMQTEKGYGKRRKNLMLYIQLYLDEPTQSLFIFLPHFSNWPLFWLIPCCLTNGLTSRSKLTQIAVYPEVER